MGVYTIYCTWILPVEVETVKLPFVHEFDDGIDKFGSARWTGHHLRVLFTSFAPPTDGYHDFECGVDVFKSQRSSKSTCVVVR